MLNVRLGPVAHTRIHQGPFNALSGHLKSKATLRYLDPF